MGIIRKIYLKLASTTTGKGRTRKARKRKRLVVVAVIVRQRPGEGGRRERIVRAVRVTQVKKKEVERKGKVRRERVRHPFLLHLRGELHLPCGLHHHQEGEEGTLHPLRLRGRIEKGLRKKVLKKES